MTMIPSDVIDIVNRYKGIDTNNLDELAREINVFDISSKIHKWLPNQYG